MNSVSISNGLVRKLSPQTSCASASSRKRDWTDTVGSAMSFNKEASNALLDDSPEVLWISSSPILSE